MTATEERTYSAPNIRDRLVALRDLRVKGLNARTNFAEEGIATLAESIRDHGLLQPLVVRPYRHLPGTPPDTGVYEITAGERRYRALWLLALAQAMGEPIAEVLKLGEETREAWREQAGRMLVDVRDIGEVDHAVALEVMLVENLQRENLDPIEEARGYQRLAEECGWTQGQIGQAVKRSQPAIANQLRLLGLPDDVQALISAGELTISHGIALAKWAQWPEFVRGLSRLAVKDSWSTKRVEQVKPDSYDTTEARRYLESYETVFDRSICQSCSFSARWADSGGRGFCLQPSHYDQLNAEAKKAKEAAETARMAGLVAKAKATEGALPKTSEMGYGSYRDLNTIPAGCGEDCPCRTAALTYGDRPTVICTNPKRFDKLQADQKRAEQKAQRELKAQRLGFVTDAAEVVASVTRRDLVLLVEQLITTVSVPVLRDVVKRQGIDFDAERVKGYYGDSRSKRLDVLRELGEVQLLRLGVELVLRQDVEFQFAEYKVGGHILDWYLADASADAAPAGEGGDAVKSD